MRYFALATDYDGTIATHGQVFESTQTSLERLKASGRKLLLVTGRELDELLTVYPGIGLFDVVVAENGALLYTPATRQEKLLGEPPPAHFVAELLARGVGPVSVGRSIVATWEPHETTVLNTIRDLGLELQVIFNKGAVMILPSGVNKATGLKVALMELGLSRHNTVGVGDAENDHAFLSACECSAAVANALDPIKERVDYVCRIDHGAGVEELIDQMLSDDLAEFAPRLRQLGVVLGTTADGHDVHLPPFGQCVMLAGPSASGKSTVAMGLMERLCECDYQFCTIDPEGDYAELEFAVNLGSQHGAPTVQEVMELVTKPDENVVVNMVGVALAHRPAMFEELLPQLHALRVRTGRPHWLIIDEAHHLLPTNWDSAQSALPKNLGGTIFITVHPESVSPAVLRNVNLLIAVGERPAETISAFCAAVEERCPAIEATDVAPGDVVVWARTQGGEPQLVHCRPPKVERRRHWRKYAEGDLGERSFYFCGPDRKLNLKAQNLAMFLQIAEGIDDETWDFHLREHAYSRWFRNNIKNPPLADEAEQVELAGGSPQQTRQQIRALVEKHFTLPA